MTLRPHVCRADVGTEWGDQNRSCFVPRDSKTQILPFESTSGLLDGLASSALELWFLGLVLLSTRTFALRFSHDSPPKVHAVSECEPRSVGVLQMLVASSVAFLVSGDALPEPRCK